MIRMTPELAKALERLSGHVDRVGLNRFGLETQGGLAAYREAPVVEGKWTVEEAYGVWWVRRPDTATFMLDHQRQAEAYRDALNAADAALEGE